MMIPAVGDIATINTSEIARRLESLRETKALWVKAKRELAEAEGAAESPDALDAALARLGSDEFRKAFKEVSEAVRAVDAANAEREGAYAEAVEMRQYMESRASLAESERLAAMPGPTPPIADVMGKRPLTLAEDRVLPALRECFSALGTWANVQSARKRVEAAEAALALEYNAVAPMLKVAVPTVDSFMETAEALAAYAKDARTKELAAIAEAEAALAARKNALPRS